MPPPSRVNRTLATHVATHNAGVGRRRGRAGAVVAVRTAARGRAGRAHGRCWPHSRPWSGCRAPHGRVGALCGVILTVAVARAVGRRVATTLGPGRPGHAGPGHARLRGGGAGRRVVAPAAPGGAGGRRWPPWRWRWTRSTATWRGRPDTQSAFGGPVRRRGRRVPAAGAERARRAGVRRVGVDHRRGPLRLLGRRVGLRRGSAAAAPAAPLAPGGRRRAGRRPGRRGRRRCCRPHRRTSRSRSRWRCSSSRSAATCCGWSAPPRPPGRRAGPGRGRAAAGVRRPPHRGRDRAGADEAGGVPAGGVRRPGELHDGRRDPVAGAPGRDRAGRLGARPVLRRRRTGPPRRDGAAAAATSASTATRSPWRPRAAPPGTCPAGSRSPGSHRCPAGRSTWCCCSRRCWRSGDKAPLLAAVAAALRPGGRFALTVEEGRPLTAAERARDARGRHGVAGPAARVARRAGSGRASRSCSVEEYTDAHRATAEALADAFLADRPAIPPGSATGPSTSCVTAHRLWADWLRQRTDPQVRRRRRPDGEPRRARTRSPR